MFENNTSYEDVEIDNWRKKFNIEHDEVNRVLCESEERLAEENERNREECARLIDQFDNLKAEMSKRHVRLFLFDTNNKLRTLKSKIGRSSLKKAKRK